MRSLLQIRQTLGPGDVDVEVLDVDVDLVRRRGQRLSSPAKPMEPDVEDQAAREHAAAWLDQRIAEGPKRMVDVQCAGCGLLRQLKPGETHCYPCRKALSKE